MLLGMGLIGWVVSLVSGFVVGGIFFLSMKLQVEYVVEKRGPTWLLPVATYARMALVAAVLVIVALIIKQKDWHSKTPAMMFAGVIGMIVARVLVARMVGGERAETPKEKADD